MLENIFTVGEQVVVLFILIGVGALSKKTKILNDAAIKGITEFVLYVVTPCVIIKSYQREFDTTMITGLAITFAAAVASHIINIIMARLLVHDSDARRQNVLRFGAVFSNCGYMSLPLQQALLGDDGVFYGATFIAVFNIVLWTYGVFAMSGDKKNVSPKKVILNPGVLGTIVGIVLFLCSVRLPQVLYSPIEYLAALNTPLPMVVVGYRLAGAKLKLSGKGTYMGMLYRLILSPLIMLGGLYLCGVRGVMMTSCVIAASAPCAAATTMFAEKFGGDTELSAAYVSITTILSVVTMPIIVGLSMAI